MARIESVARPRPPVPIDTEPAGCGPDFTSPGMMAASGLPAAARTQMSNLVLGSHSLDAVLQQVIEAAMETIPSARDVSITLIVRGRPRTIAAARTLAAALDERQYQDEDGPSIEAALTQQTITVDDTVREQRYPRFCEEAARQDVRRVVCLGMAFYQDINAALNMYGHGRPGPFEGPATDTLAVFARYAAPFILNYALYAEALQRVDLLQTLLRDNAGIEQAKGIIMRAQHCRPHEADSVLRNVSSITGRDIRAVAQTMIDDLTS